MKVEVAIGEVHRFELREALLIYRENQRSFITLHSVEGKRQGTPVLGPAQPLTTGFLENLADSLGGSAAAEVLPENILAKSDRMIAWWTPRCRRRMFYEAYRDLIGRLSDCHVRGRLIGDVEGAVDTCFP